MAGVGLGRGRPTQCRYVELALSATIADDLVGLRRDLHRLPEIGLHLPQAELGELGDLDLEITTGAALNSVVAVLRGTKNPDAAECPVVLLRDDMAALPVTEKVDVD